MKTAQVTLFVVFGLVLVLIAAFFIIQFQSLEQPQVTTHVFDAVTATYENQASYCLLDEGYEAFRDIFANGGYENPLEQGFVAFADYPLQGSALSLSENKMIPYWLEHHGSVNCRTNCPISTHVPPLLKTDGSGSIEEQAEQHLEENVQNCLDRITLPAYN